MIFHLRLCLASGLFPSGLPSNICMHLCSGHTYNMTRPSHSSWFDQLLSNRAIELPPPFNSTPTQFSPYFLRIKFTISTSFLSSKNALRSPPYLLTIHRSDDTGRFIQVSMCISLTRPLTVSFGCRLQLKCDGTRWRTGGEVKRKLANGVGSQYPSHCLGTRCIQHYYRWCAQLGCQ